MGFKSFFRIDKGVVLRPESTTPTDSSATGALFYSSTGDVFRGHSGGQYRDLLTADQSQTVTNKVIDPALNDITLPQNAVLIGDGSNQAASGFIVNANIDAAAAIARSKVASGSIDHVVINNASGLLSSEQYLSKSRGGAGSDMSAVTFPASGVLVTEAGSQVLSNKSFSNNVSVTGNVTLTGHVELIRVDSAVTGTLATLTPADAGYIKLTSGSLVSLEGIVAGANGQMLTLTNDTGVNVVIANDTGATVANRILTGTGANITLTNQSSLDLVYDSNDSRWRVIGGTGSGSGTPNYNAYFDGTGALASEQYVAKSRGGAAADMTNVTFPSTGVILTDLSTIARSQVASGSPDHVVINNASGLLSSEAFLSKARGGVGASATGITFPSSGVLAVTGDLGWDVSVQTGLSASGTITLSTRKQQLIVVNATTTPGVTLSSTPFGTTPPPNGTSIRIMGTADNQSVTILNNTAANGCVLNGDVTLGSGDMLEVMYVSGGGFNNYVEVCRNQQ